MATQLNRALPFTFGNPSSARQHQRQRLPAVRRAANPQQQHEAETAAQPSDAGRPCWRITEQGELLSDVHHLEQSFLQPSAAPSPKPAAALQATAAQVAAVAATGAVAAGAGTAAASGNTSSTGLRLQLRSSYIRQALPLHRTVRTAEQKLGAELPAVGFAILLMVAVIMYDRGWNNVLDRFDDSVLGDVCCMIGGLGMVFGVKLMGWQPKDYFNV